MGILIGAMAWLLSIAGTSAIWYGVISGSLFAVGMGTMGVGFSAAILLALAL